LHSGVEGMSGGDMSGKRIRDLSGRSDARWEDLKDTPPSLIEVDPPATERPEPEQRAKTIGELPGRSKRRWEDFTPSLTVSSGFSHASLQQQMAALEVEEPTTKRARQEEQPVEPGHSEQVRASGGSSAAASSTDVFLVPATGGSAAASSMDGFHVAADAGLESSLDCAPTEADSSSSGGSPHVKARRSSDGVSDGVVDLTKRFLHADTPTRAKRRRAMEERKMYPDYQDCGPLGDTPDPDADVPKRTWEKRMRKWRKHIRRKNAERLLRLGKPDGNKQRAGPK